MFQGQFRILKSKEWKSYQFKPNTVIAEEFKFLADEYIETDWILDATFYWKGRLGQAFYDVQYLLDLRAENRLEKNWEQSDKLRTLLDELNVFVFDLPKNETMTYHLGQSFFKNLKLKTIRNTKEDTETQSAIDFSYFLNDKKEFKTKRKYLEYFIEEDKKTDALTEAWIYTQNQKFRLKER
jgi:hypothetical protein